MFFFKRPYNLRCFANLQNVPRDWLAPDLDLEPSVTADVMKKIPYPPNCRYCGVVCGAREYHVSHVIAKKLFLEHRVEMANKYWNIQYLCIPCSTVKSGFLDKGIS